MNKNNFNLDITISLGCKEAWGQIKVFELDYDNSWGFTIGLFTCAMTNTTIGGTTDRSLFYYSKNRFCTRLSIGFINILERYK